jgi:hypothetical protein
MEISPKLLKRLRGLASPTFATGGQKFDGREKVAVGAEAVGKTFP